MRATIVTRVVLALLLAVAAGCNNAPKPPPKPVIPAYDCDIADAGVANGTLDPANICMSCQIAVNKNGYSARADGIACDAGAVCLAGACTEGCFIDGGFFDAGSVDPRTICQTCQPLTDTFGWSAIPDGLVCDAGFICAEGACEKRCLIDDAGFAANEVDPLNPCSICNPPVSNFEWQTFADGTDCGSGEVCLEGQCSSGCYVGELRSPDSANPENPCEECDPAASTQSWTPLADGTSCGPGEVCADDTCGSGCFIDGGYIPAGSAEAGDPCQVCEPSISATTWSQVAEGRSCGTGLVCSAGACIAGCFVDGGLLAPQAANAADSCQSCQPSLSTSAWTNAADGTACGAGTVCGAGACVSDCFIDGGLYASNAPNPLDLCELCHPALSTTQWGNAADGTACSACNSCASGVCSPTGLVNDSSFGLNLQGHGAPLPNFVTLHGNLAYVTDSYGSALVRTQLDGGGAAVVASTFSYPAGLAVNAAGNTVYVADSYSGQFDAVDVATGVVTPFASGTNPVDVAVDSARVYYAFNGNSSSPGGVFSVTPDGGNALPYGDGGAPEAIAVDASGIYWIDDANFAVTYAPVDAGPARVLAPTLGFANGIGIDGTNVYWTTSDGGVYQTAKDGGAPLLLNPAGGDPFPQGVASDGANVYFADYNNGSGSGGYLKRVPVGGGTVVTLSSFGSPNHVALDSQCVYWTTYDGESLQKTDK